MIIVLSKRHCEQIHLPIILAACMQMSPSGTNMLPAVEYVHVRHKKSSSLMLPHILLSLAGSVFDCWRLLFLLSLSLLVKAGTPPSFVSLSSFNYSLCHSVFLCFSFLVMQRTRHSNPFLTLCAAKATKSAKSTCIPHPIPSFSCFYLFLSMCVLHKCNG